MNWPAKKDANQPSGYLRGVPDLSSSFAKADTNDVLVWETFKEKRELCNKGDGHAIVENGKTYYPSSVNKESTWQDLTFAKPQQIGTLGGVPLCTEAAPSPAHLTHRVFAQRTKAANYTDFTETDETVEVASQACEAAAQLCAGLPQTATEMAPSYQDCITNIFSGTREGVCEGALLDQRTPVGPRVWNGDPGTDKDARPIYFEVKVNYDFWDYILEKGFQLDKNASQAASSPRRREHPKLPFRTSSGQGPGRSPNSVFDYDADRTAKAYGRLADPNTLPGIGSVQLKAGWLVLTDEEVATNSYHTAQGYHFKTETKPGASAETQTCAQPATFGLLALHIIQRVHSLEPVNRGSGFAYGGTFVFATWEHVGLGDYEQKTDYFYANYLAFGQNFFLQGGPKLPPEQKRFAFNTNEVPFPYWKAGKPAIPLVRQQPYPLATTTSVNTAAHAAIKHENPNSVWLNYRLIGTQFFAANFEQVDAAGRQPSET